MLAIEAVALDQSDPVAQPLADDRRHVAVEFARHDLATGVEQRLRERARARPDLEYQVARGDAAALEAAIADARAALDQRIGPTDQRGPIDLVGTVTGQWNGILRVAWDPPDPPAEAQTPAVADVVRECLSNAIVHGLAEHAVIAIAVEANAVVVRIADNGQGPRGGEPGFGSAVLNEATGGDWSITAGADGGAVVAARLPLAPLT